MVGSSPSARTWLTRAMLILGLGFATRAYAVGQSALRGDEAFSANVAQMPAREMLALMGHVDPNPPLYLFLLKGWIGLVGASELSLRWPSVLSGVTSIALTLRLGRCWGNAAAGRVAAVLLALSPFAIWYAQDARVYALWMALTLAAFWQTGEAAVHGSARRWAIAGGVWLAALLAHYFAALGFAVAGLAWLLTPAMRARWRPALLMAAGVGLLYLPWGFYVAPLLLGHTKNWIAALPGWHMAQQTLIAFSTGTTLAAPWTYLGAALLGGALMFGVARLGKPALPYRAWWAALALGQPLLLIVFSYLRPMFTEQYLIPSLPGALLLAALGVEAARRWSKPWLSHALVAGLLALGLLSAGNYFFNPVYAKSANWRAVMRYLEITQRPDEVILLNVPDPVFAYYYHGASPVDTAPTAAPLNVVETEAQLQRLRDNFQHIRFFFSPNPEYDREGFVARWLEGCCEKTADEVVSQLRIQSFDTPTGSLAARQDYAADFANGLRLTGYRLLASSLAPGATLHLTLFWTTQTPVTTSYTVFVHLLAADGFEVGNADDVPRAGQRPTSTWAADEMIVDPHRLLLDANLPPGRYRLEVGLYDLVTGNRLPVTLSTGETSDLVALPEGITVVNP